MRSYYFECFCPGDYRPVVGSVLAASEEEAKSRIREMVPHLEEIVVVRLEIPGELHGRAYIARSALQGSVEHSC